MVTRGETTAATRRALLEAAAGLLDAGGPDAVTLREVGARAGVSRSAPYRHFSDKGELLTVVATGAWSDLGDTLAELVAEADAELDADARPGRQLRRALLALLDTGRSRPHLYRLMFSTRDADPTAVARAAERTQDLFLRLVTAVVGAGRARPCAALLLTSVHGITGLELSGHLTTQKWDATAEDLVEVLLGLLSRGPGEVDDDR